jgi:hypothetical protein
MLRMLVRSLSLVAILAGTSAAAAGDPPADKASTAKVVKKSTHKAKAKKKAARKTPKHKKAKKLAKPAKVERRPMP